jgi:hypothetical protein
MTASGSRTAGSLRQRFEFPLDNDRKGKKMRIALVLLSIAVLTLSALLFVKAHPANATDPQARVFSHFECYDPNPQGQPPPPPRNVVQLTDQFQQFTTDVGPAILFCTPVMKQLQPGVNPLPVPAPADHLECYVIAGPQVAKRVLAANQLQRQTLTINAPKLLCVPTHKKLLR